MTETNGALASRLNVRPEQLADFCRRWGIVRLEIFGSALRPDFGPASDADFLYTLSSEVHWGWKFFEAQDELETMVGRPVDLVSRKGVEQSENVNRRRDILQSATVIYAA